jgi:hypothetical protein
MEAPPDSLTGVSDWGGFLDVARHRPWSRALRPARAIAETLATRLPIAVENLVAGLRDMPDADGHTPRIGLEGKADARRPAAKPATIST